MKRTRAFVDGVDAGVARLLTTDGKRTFTLPSALLPRASREGSWVTITVEPSDPPAPVARTKRTRPA